MTAQPTHLSTEPARAGAGVRRVVRLGRTLGRTLVGGLGNLVLVACLVAFLGLAVGPHVFGYRTMTMLTGSMAPVISPGDVAVSFPKATRDLEVGDVISYQIPVEDHRVETHRITEVIHRDDGTVAIRTKGDANAGVDPWTAEVRDDTVYVTRHVIPEVGNVIRALRHPWIQQYGLWLALGGTLLLGLSRIWAAPAKDETEPEPAGTDAPVDAVFEVIVLHEATLRRLADDVEDEIFVDGFASRYQELLPARLDRIQHALEADDLEQAVDATLSLKVASSTVGTRELADLADCIFEDLRADDLAAALASAQVLPTVAERADAALAAYLDRRGLATV
ncbi:hypothetical protein [Nocardioides sp. W7]|uniref:hypothetical protein n=1 Tax=Nocardioides sp. W7 TaxID=2931390 RepID=UPI001FD26F23|nr:hypothetical protein [Nocardioides sp. W7]